MKYFLKLMSVFFSFLLLSSTLAKAGCLGDYHCVSTGQCTSINTTCQNVVGAGISVTILGSGGGTTVAYSYQTFGFPSLYIGTVAYKKGSDTSTYNLLCGYTKYYIVPGCPNSGCCWQPNYVNTCPIIPGQ